MHNTAHGGREGGGGKGGGPAQIMGDRGGWWRNVKPFASAKK